MIYNVGNGGATSADKIDYDNTDSGLQAENVQDGIDELNSNLGDISDIETSTLNSVAKLLQYWIDKGELSDPNMTTLVPKMTSATSPSGIVTQSNQESGNPAWHVFDQLDDYWSAGSGHGTNQYVCYQFTNPVIPKKFALRAFKDNNGTQIKNFKIQGSNNGSTWTDLYSGINENENDNYIYGNIENNTQYQYLRLLIVDSYSTNFIACRNLQFYGRT